MVSGTTHNKKQGGKEMKCIYCGDEIKQKHKAGKERRICYKVECEKKYRAESMRKYNQKRKLGLPIDHRHNPNKNKQVSTGVGKGKSKLSVKYVALLPLFPQKEK